MVWGRVRGGWGGRLEGPVPITITIELPGNQGNYRTQKKSLTINRSLALPYGLGSLYMVNHCNRKKGPAQKMGNLKLIFQLLFSEHGYLTWYETYTYKFSICTENILI